MSNPNAKAPSRGRPKGATNKVTRTVKESFIDAFLRTGGSDNLVAYAQASNANMTEFLKLAARIIPTEVVGADGGPLIVEIVKESNQK